MDETMKILKELITIIVIVILFSGCIGKDKIQPTNTPVSTISEKGQKVIDLAKEDLAGTLSISVDDIKLSNIEEVTWPDSSLGYPNPGEQYLQVETPGYKIFLSYKDKIYEYHSDYERVIPPPSKEQ